MRQHYNETTLPLNGVGLQQAEIEANLLDLRSKLGQVQGVNPTLLRLQGTMPFSPAPAAPFQLLPSPQAGFFGGAPAAPSGCGLTGMVRRLFHCSPGPACGSN
jgi:hypothetical protein